MEANELMIGDWVQDITPVFIDAISNEDICTYRAEYGYITANPSNLKPIPLTAEILEKNGFIRQQFGHFRYENEDNDLVMAFYPKEKNYTEGGYDYIDIYKGRMTLREMPISYVHELQHALRLCGIDKEIVL